MTMFTPTPFSLPKLPYAKSALEPFISAETLHFHYEKHHRGYLDALNRLLVGRPDLHGRTLPQIIRSSEGPLFENAAQVWNHTFYWHSMSPHGGGRPTGAIGAAIRTSPWRQFESFQESFNNAGKKLFGSGWVWVVQNAQGHIGILPLPNADNPIRHNLRPLLVCDVWEHAYYIDQRNDRGAYLDNWWHVVNWDFANHNLDR